MHRLTYITDTNNYPHSFPQISRLLSEWEGNMNAVVVDDLFIDCPINNENIQTQLGFDVMDSYLISKIKSCRNLDGVHPHRFVEMYWSCEGVDHVVVALDDGNDDVKIFKGECLTSECIKKDTFFLGPRWRAYIKLVHCVRHHNYTGLFESHITVNSKEIEKFRSVCERIGCKSVLIELPKGETPKQLMTSKYHPCTNLETVMEHALLMANEFELKGLDVSRVKIEAMFSTQGVPITDEEATLLSPRNYFEFHIQLKLPSTIEKINLEKLESVISVFGGKLSRNALKNEGEFQFRFITLRMYKIGKTRAEAILSSCVNDIQEKGFIVSSQMREYSVYDSNVALDKGWI